MQPPVTDPQQRVLCVLNAVLDHGPITLAALARHLPFSQSAIYRALQHLIAQGWVQVPVFGTGFIASQKLTALSQNRRHGFACRRHGTLIAKALRQVGRLDIDIVTLSMDGHIDRVEASNPARHPLGRLLLTTSLAGRAAVCALDPPQKVTFLRRYLAFADDNERTKSRTPQFAKLFSYGADHRILMDTPQATWAFGFRLCAGAGPDMPQDMIGALQLTAPNRHDAGQRLYGAVNGLWDLEQTNQLSGMTFLIDMDKLSIVHRPEKWAPLLG